MTGPCSQSLSFAQLILTFLLGLFTAIVVEPLRRRLLRPSLKIDFDQFAGSNARQTDGSIVLRFRVINRTGRPATKCRAYLIRVEVPASASDRSLLLDEPGVLAWAFTSVRSDQPRIDLPRVDLYPAMSHYVDLAVVNPEKSLRFTTSMRGSVRAAHEGSAKFISTVAVVSEEGSYVKRTFELSQNHPGGEFIWATSKRFWPR